MRNIDIYGPSTCPICGNRKETIFAGERYQLTCRNHPGHPLYEEGPARYTTREGLASRLTSSTPGWPHGDSND